MMSKRILYVIIYAIIVVCLVFAIAAGVIYANREEIGYWLFGDRPTSIDSFSEELNARLEEHYQIRIPDNARFVSGCYTNSWQDPAIAIQFELDLSVTEEDLVEEELYELMLTDGVWGRGGYTNNKIANEIFGYDVIYTREFRCIGKDFTYLFYTVSEDGIVQCCFYGHHPGKTPATAPPSTQADALG